MSEQKYPQVVYHKDYQKNPKGEKVEKERELLSKKVHSEEEYKKLGPDWGDHPHSKQADSKQEVKADLKKK